MITTLRFIIILLITINGYAQSGFNADGFEVTKQDIELKVFEQDSTANALIIYETGKSYVDNDNFYLNTEIRKKLKILNRNGFKKATEAIFLYSKNGKKETIDDIRATVYNIENGQVTKTKLDNSAIFEEKYNDNYTVTKFTFPNIKEGSVIVFSYKLKSPYMYKYKSWYFQEDIPKLYSEYQPSIPGNWQYNIKLVGGKELTTNDSKIRHHCLKVSNGGSSHCADYDYVMKNIPAFVPEKFMTTRENYLARIEYELKVFQGFDGVKNDITKSWKTVDQELKTDKDFGRQLKKSSLSKDLLSEDIINEKNTLVKAQGIFNYVASSYTWDKTYHIFNDVSLKDLVDNKSGNISEINILLHNLLEANGIDVKPVLLSTRDNGFVTKIYPVLSDFNYLIVQATIDQKTYLLDATESYLTFGQLPFRCLNQYGRLLDFKNGGSWLDINAKQMSVDKYSLHLDIDDNNLLHGDVEGLKTGYHALNAKKSYFENTDDYLNDYIQKYPTTEFLHLKSKTEHKTDSEFSETFEVNQLLEPVGDNLYVNPFLLTFFEENPFKLQKRTYPIDFGYKDVYIYQLELNTQNYDVVDIPKPMSMSLPNNTGKLIYNVTTNKDSILLYLKFSFKEAIYDPAYYESLKQYFSTIVDIQKNSLIVLKKKQ